MDKLLHFLVGAVIAATAFPLGWPLAVVLTAVAAAGKEVWDASGRGTPDAIDALATVAGGFLMTGWLWLHFTF